MKRMNKKNRRYLSRTLVALLATCMWFSVPVQAKTKTKKKCAMCKYYAREGSEYCYKHTCHWPGGTDDKPACTEGVYNRKYCSKHTCKWIGCDEIVYYGTDVQACRYHYRKYEAMGSASKSSSSKSSTVTSSKSSSQSSSAKKCKYSGCKNYGVSYKKGYCNKHYRQLYETRDDYYDEDPESYYQDNKSQYQSRSEAYDDWEDEYEED